MLVCSVAIPNALGLHARAAARFVHAAGRFASQVRVARGDREVNGKSIMGLLLLTAARGSSIRITVDGSDEQDALQALCALVERGFDEAPFGPSGAPHGGSCV
ncbi:MAG: HPr family phosphocarrier protein [Vicinamibacterales bacterium]